MVWYNDHLQAFALHSLHRQYVAAYRVLFENTLFYGCFHPPGKFNISITSVSGAGLPHLLHVHHRPRIAAYRVNGSLVLRRVSMDTAVSHISPSANTIRLSLCDRRVRLDSIRVDSGTYLYCLCCEYRLRTAAYTELDNYYLLSSYSI